MYNKYKKTIVKSKMYGIKSNCKREMSVITELCHFRNIGHIGANSNEIVIINTCKRVAHAYDIETICNFTKLEKIYMVTDELAFLYNLLDNIHFFHNLYDLSIIYKSYDEKNKMFKEEELVKENCYDIAGVLLIKHLELCDIMHTDEDNVNCVKCFTLNSLQNTESTKCVIQNFVSDSLLNLLSTNIKFLTIVVGNNDKVKVNNLPFNLEKLVIVYKTLQKPKDFYISNKSNIKLPYNCKLKILQDYDVLQLNIDERHYDL